MVRAVARALPAMMLVAGCMSPAQEESMETDAGARITVASDAFEEGQAIPTKYTCDGSEVSPPLRWSGAPDDVGAYALLVTDPDARNFVHWAVVDIPKVAGEFAEGASGTADVGIEGRNSSGDNGWAGPCPPSGTHRYVFTVYALSSPLGLDPGFDAGTLQDKLSSQTLARGELTGTYARAR